MISKTGKFYGIGVGPGDPELITLKAIRILEQVDAVIAPRGKGESIALKIAKPYIRGEVFKLEFPMIYEKEALEPVWDENVKKIKELLYGGKDVAFITLGDPMIYSSYIYILKRLKDFEVATIPGITSFSAAAARLNLPIAEGKEPFAVVPAGDLQIVERALSDFDNVVLMKVSRNYVQIADLLQEKGFTAGLIIRCGHQEEEVTFDLEKYRGGKIDYLSLIIGKKVGS